MDSRQTLLDVLSQHAENGWVCPSLPQLAKLTGINASTVGEYLRRLRRDGKITSRLVNIGIIQQARIVTITSTGKSTAEPRPTHRRTKPETPTEYKPSPHALTSPVRVLTGPEFERRAAELLARDAAERVRSRA